MLISNFAFSQSIGKGISVKWDSLPTDNSVINGAGGTEEVFLNADGDWTIYISEGASSWLSVSPLSGHSGKTRVRITSSPNTSKANRTGTITVFPAEMDNILSITQRAQIFNRQKCGSGIVLNHILLDYSGTDFTRIYSLLPVPQSCQYQEISGFVGSGSVEKCINNDNYYLANDLSVLSIPPTGGSIISSLFEVTYNSVTADLSMIDDIPEPDISSKPYKEYLGDEKGGYIAPSNTDIKAIADALWGEAGGDMVDYARRCHLWTAKNMIYGNPYTGLHAVKELMRIKTGDCGNYCSVFISLLRAKGIPSRHVVMISPNKSEKHIMAEFYVPGYGWIPADPTSESKNPFRDTTPIYFGRFVGKYVVLSFGINSIAKGPNNENVSVPLLQTCNYWYWNEKQGWFEFRHIFSNL